MAWHHVLRVRELQLASVAKLILYALASRADRHGYCWPSVRRICADTGLHRRAIQVHLARLTTAGWLIREQRNGQSNTFRLAFERSEERPNNVQEFAPTSAAGLAITDTQDEVAGVIHTEPKALTKAQAEARTSRAPPAHEVRAPAHDMRTPCARGALEEEREELLDHQKKSARGRPVVDKPAGINAANRTAWWHSEAAVMAQGIRLGVTPAAGEDYRTYKDRVYKAWHATRAQLRTEPRDAVRRAQTGSPQTWGIDGGKQIRR